MDASWAKFVDMLSYKAIWHDRVVLKVSRFYPSSQTCNCCAEFRGKLPPEISHTSMSILKLKI